MSDGSSHIAVKYVGEHRICGINISFRRCTRKDIRAIAVVIGQGNVLNDSPVAARTFIYNSVIVNIFAKIDDLVAILVVSNYGK